MHHFVFHSRLRHAWLGRILETAEHLHLRPNSAAVEFQRLFAATTEKQIWGCTNVFELDIRVACDSFG